MNNYVIKYFKALDRSNNKWLIKEVTNNGEHHRNHSETAGDCGGVCHWDKDYIDGWCKTIKN